MRIVTINRFLRRVTVVLLMIGLFGCIEEENPTYEATSRVGVGDMAPDFSVPTLDGKRMTLSAERGKVVLVLFFNSWCPDCRAELSGIEQRIAPFSTSDFVLLAIARGEDHTTIAPYRQELGLTIDLGLDADESTYQRYATRYVPRNYVVDRDGRIVATATEPSPEELDALFAQIARLATH